MVGEVSIIHCDGRKLEAYAAPHQDFSIEFLK